MTREKIEGKEHDYWIYNYGAIIITAKDGFPESHISRFELQELEEVLKKAKEWFNTFEKIKEINRGETNAKRPNKI